MKIDKNKKYLFIDKKPLVEAGNFNDLNTSIRFSGLVYGIHETKPSFSGKDLAVVFHDPLSAFNDNVERQWRSIDDVELMEIQDFDYDLLMSRFDKQTH